jgi:hypothetical protein
MSQMALPNPHSRRLGRSTLAILAGMIAGAVLSLGTDQILHVLDVYPPWGEPMYDPELNALALAYRIVYTVIGGYLTARLAPHAPMRHVMILGCIGLVVSSAGALVAITQHDLGPAWYPIALALVTIPCCWLGGLLRVRQTGE